MKSPTLATIKKLFTFSLNKCAYPGCENFIIDKSTGTVLGKICHIKAASKKGPRYDPKQTDEERHDFNNLILLCPIHHDIIDRNVNNYDVDMLRYMKEIHENHKIKEEPEDEFFAKLLYNNSNSINVTNNKGKVQINSPGAVQTENLTIKTTKKKINLLPPEGTVGSDLKVRGYVKHLIDRYNDFASKDPTRSVKFSFPAIYTTIISQFGIKWDLVPLSKVNKLIEYLQKRILATRQSKINKGKGYKSFSTFEEYIEKHFKE